MFSFIEWLVEREILECNQFLFEAATRTKVVAFPKLEMVIMGAMKSSGKRDRRFFSIKNIERESKEQYVRELEVEMRDKERGFSNSKTVFINMMRHRLMNYDEVRDSISEATTRRQITICQKLFMERELFTKVSNLINTMLSALPHSILIPNDDEATYQADLARENSRQMTEKTRDVEGQINHRGCKEDPVSPEPEKTADTAAVNA